MLSTTATRKGPRVLSEAETIDICQHASIARFGDGELRIAAGGGCSSQRPDKNLRREFVRLLERHGDTALLVAIPNFEKTPRKDVWDRYAGEPYASLYRRPVYGSSFITRPDNAPWIDAPEYWDSVRALWRGRDVTLVTGDAKSLTPQRLEGAASVREINGPRTDAYTEIDRIEEEIGTPAGPVLLCLGACATALAARLSRKGVHALDLGHIGMFMKHAGLYSLARPQLLTDQYREQLAAKHSREKWGIDGGYHADAVRAFADQLGARSILDYGCGAGTLQKAMRERRIMEYDPGIKGKDALPKPADLVVCTDVLEHVEPEKVDAVLRHIYLLAGKGAFFCISTRPAREKLPDGRNAHLSVFPREWWLEKIYAMGWTEAAEKDDRGLCVWLKK